MYQTLYILLLIILLSIISKNPKFSINTTAIVIATIIVHRICSIMPLLLYQKRNIIESLNNDFTGAVSALAGNDEARWTVAGEATGVVVTYSALAVIQLTLVHVLASTAGFPRETRIAFALVTLLGVDALPVAADVRPQRALVYLGDRLQLRAKPVVIVYN